jgi:hypothetical protein
VKVPLVKVPYEVVFSACSSKVLVAWLATAKAAPASSFMPSVVSLK